MCGLAGFYDSKAEKTRTELHVIAKKMNDTLIHRGPDSGDIWQDDAVPLVLAHRRLAILDLSREGAQPMSSASGRFKIAFNGEIYNHMVLREDLSAAGFVFRGRSDTETLLAAIDHWGLNLALQKINGMFAFALWDQQERQLHLVRDRMGKKPLYVGWAGGALVFASELKALRAHPDFKAEVNEQARDEFLSFGFCRAPYSIYKRVWSLPPGHRMSLDVQNVTPGTDLTPDMIAYWNAAQMLQQSKNTTQQKSVEEFEQLLMRCVSDRLISDVPLGAFLSGGIDSSLVTALMQKVSSHPVQTYTVGFEEAGFDEAAHAKKIAAHLGTDHHEIYVTAKDAQDVIPQLPDMYDEPFADVSAIPTYLISRFARQNVTVALTGDGGDEMLGGYARHMQGPKIWNMKKLSPKMLRNILGGLIKMIGTKGWDSLRPGHPQFGMRMHKMANVLGCRNMQELYLGLLGGAQHEVDLPELEGLNTAETLMFWDSIFYLPHNILTKTDRASMAVGLEARAPFLDKRIFEYVWSLPHDMKIKNGQGKHLLRSILKHHLPEHLFERPKQGFNMPIGDWLRGPLRDWAEDLLEHETPETRKLWSAHLNGRGYHTETLWNALMFQAWQLRWQKK